ncbi:hypothetical protein KOI35_41105 [Actinoplanes bogorensis]|uniref:AbiV family abortive infection protein n=1 Tax=Paractinoplanes bogorensis TaxID=1610840 RepID=A0ABS5Z2M0_9ACTN|nr:hypothetical protein [Actinoplanes bogorensis]MBU2669928.1 hypothetical protein [Actinoplanes bogorensis]
MTIGLTQEQKLSLVHECTDASALFTRGLDMLASVRDDDTGAVAVMSLLALGAEKMLKLTIGLATVDQGRPWPSKSEMRDIGHQVLAADSAARPLLRRLRGTAPGHLTGLEAEVDADAILPVVLEALDRFGSAGRFYHLDVLAEAKQPAASPRHLWHDATTAVMKQDPGLGAAIDGTTDHAVARRRWNNTMVTSLRTWWEMYYAAWRSGVIGDLAHQFAGELKLRDIATV